MSRTSIMRGALWIGAVFNFGKLGVFVVAVACWVLGELPGAAVVPAIGDLLFGLVFLWWLRGELRELAKPGQS